MAQVEKYNVHSLSPFGDDRIFKIYEEGYAGAVIDVLGTRIPAKGTWPGSDVDLYYPIMGTEVLVNLVAETADQYIEFAEATNKQYLGVLYNSTQSQIEWQGWYVPEEMETNESTLPQTVNLTFACGLGYLQGIDYLNGSNYYTGRERECVILARALAEITADSPNNLGIRSIINLHPTGASTAYSHGALYYSYTDQNKYINDDGTVWNCLDVIRDIVKSYGARIIMGNAGWWVIRLRAFALWQEDKIAYYAFYTSAGVYSGNGSLTAAQGIKTVTGPYVTSRSEDVSWTGQSKRNRNERAVKEVKTKLLYNYKNILGQGNFSSENWLDFWSIEDGTIVRVTDTEEDGKFFIRMDQDVASDKAELQQIITNVEQGSSDQFLTFKAQVRYTGVAAGEQVTFAIELYLDSGAGPASDKWLAGEFDSAGGGGGSSPSWNGASNQFLFTVQAGDSEWVDVEVTTPVIPFTGNNDTFYLQLWNANVTGGTGVYCDWRDVKLFGSYDGVDIINQEEEENLLISENNMIDLPAIEIQSGDVAVDGNEWVFFKNAKSLDSDGDTLTTTWRSFYASGGAKVMYGPDQSLLLYLRDNQVVQYGLSRRRLQGSLSFNWHRIARGIIQDGDYYYIPTSLGYDYMSSLLRISMLELPKIEAVIIDTNLITSWVNNTWDTFVVTSAPLIDSMTETPGTTGIATGNNIESLVPYESFRVQVTGSFVAVGTTLAIGSWNDNIEDGYDAIITPKTTAGNNIVTLSENAAGPISNTNVLVKVTRIYGF